MIDSPANISLIADALTTIGFSARHNEESGCWEPALIFAYSKESAKAYFVVWSPLGDGVELRGAWQRTPDRPSGHYTLDWVAGDMLPFMVRSVAITNRFPLLGSWRDADFFMSSKLLDLMGWQRAGQASPASHNGWTLDAVGIGEPGQTDAPLFATCLFKRDGYVPPAPKSANHSLSQ